MCSHDFEVITSPPQVDLCEQRVWTYCNREIRIFDNGIVYEYASVGKCPSGPSGTGWTKANDESPIWEGLEDPAVRFLSRSN